MITKRYGVDFSSDGGALTLPARSVGKSGGWKIHTSGWAIAGDIHEDYYKWVNSFSARHSVFGCVWGDFENDVFADSEAAYNHFLDHHYPEAWDYQDI